MAANGLKAFARNASRRAIVDNQGGTAPSGQARSDLCGESEGRGRDLGARAQALPIAEQCKTRARHCPTEDEALAIAFDHPLAPSLRTQFELVYRQGIE